MTVTGRWRVSSPQTRGSIPFYWSQRPNLKYKPKPQINKTMNHVSSSPLRYAFVYLSLRVRLLTVCVSAVGRFPETLWLTGYSLWKTSYSQPGETKLQIIIIMIIIMLMRNCNIEQDLDMHLTTINCSYDSSAKSKPARIKIRADRIKKKT